MFFSSPLCRPSLIHGQLKHSIFQGYSTKASDGLDLRGPPLPSHGRSTMCISSTPGEGSGKPMPAATLLPRVENRQLTSNFISNVYSSPRNMKACFLATHDLLVLIFIQSDKCVPITYISGSSRQGCPGVWRVLNAATQADRSPLFTARIHHAVSVDSLQAKSDQINLAHVFSNT